MTMEENVTVSQETKFCKECGQRIAKKAVICPQCGCQVEDMKSNDAPAQIVINNSNQNANNNLNVGVGAPVGTRLGNKWVAFFLCLFLGYFGAHKFYEGKVGGGILYMLTFGLFAIGWFIDLISLLCKPNPYLIY